jgi:hypothetical protein
MDSLTLHELEQLLARASRNGSLPRAEVERVLTDGYAEALELEVERLERSRRLLELSRVVAGGPAEDDRFEAERLSDELRECTSLLLVLRGRLAEASRRFGRNPLADA